MTKKLDISGIYKIINIETGKVYVGSAVNFKDRWGKHKRYLVNGNHHSQLLQNAWNKYGESSFEFLILQKVFDLTELIRIEQVWIDRLKAADRSYGYNICTTAGSLLGAKHTQETKDRISASMSRAPRSEETKAKISIAVKLAKSMAVISDSTRAKLSAGRKGRKASLETRKKISQAASMRVGIKQSAESIAKRMLSKSITLARKKEINRVAA